MRRTICAALSLALLAAITGCGSKDAGTAASPSAPGPGGASGAATPPAGEMPGPPPGMTPPGPAGASAPGAAAEAAKPADTAAAQKPAPKKEADDSDDPFGSGGAKTVTGALGNAFLKSVTPKFKK